MECSEKMPPSHLGWCLHHTTNGINDAKPVSFTDKPRQFFWFLPEVLALVAFRVKLKGWRELLAVSSLRLYVNIHLCWESIVQKFILIYRMNTFFFFMPFWSFSFPVWKYYNFHKLSLFLTPKNPEKSKLHQIRSPKHWPIGFFAGLSYINMVAAWGGDLVIDGCRWMARETQRRWERMVEWIQLRKVQFSSKKKMIKLGHVHASLWEFESKSDNFECFKTCSFNLNREMFILRIRGLCFNKDFPQWSDTASHTSHRLEGRNDYCDFTFQKVIHRHQGSILFIVNRCKWSSQFLTPKSILPFNHEHVHIYVYNIFISPNR